MASDFARNLIKIHEGLRLKPYKDTLGIWTIGYGRNLEKGISVDEARELFENDLIEAEVAIVNIFGTDIFSIGEKRVAVLLDMAFMGETRFRKFVKFIDAVKKRDWQEAAKEMEDSLWYRQVGNRGKEDKALIYQG